MATSKYEPRTNRAALEERDDTKEAAAARRARLEEKRRAPRVRSTKHAPERTRGEI
jgi:hypothetical protein